MSSTRKQPYTCGLNAAVDLIGGKWKVLILWQVQIEDRRFGELKRLVPGISDKELSRHLREMESEGIIDRRAGDGNARRVAYSLSPCGRTLIEALIPLGVWGEKNMDKIEAVRSRSGSAR